MRKLEIEPLEKARWERIERKLCERLEQEPVSARKPSSVRPQRSARPVVAFVLTGAAAAAIGALAWEKLRAAPHVLERGTQITGVETQDAPSRLELGGASLEVSAHSSARIEGSYESGVVVSLEHGAVECEVAPRNGRPPFIVHAGDVDVRVVGTHFRVDREGGVTHVSVQHGVVEVYAQGTTTRVPAGAHWPDAPPLADAGSRPSAMASVEPPVSHVPKAQAPAEIATRPTAFATSEARTPSPRERYDRALTLEATHPDEALSIYRELATTDGSWAMNALYAQARLELERGDKDTARKLFADYLSRYPTGPNANDARELSTKLQ